jgi:hypothetical protein
MDAAQSVPNFPCSFPASREKPTRDSQMPRPKIEDPASAGFLCIVRDIRTNLARHGAALSRERCRYPDSRNWPRSFLGTNFRATTGTHSRTRVLRWPRKHSRVGQFFRFTCQRARIAIRTMSYRSEARQFQVRQKTVHRVHAQAVAFARRVFPPPFTAGRSHLEAQETAAPFLSAVSVARRQGVDAGSLSSPMRSEAEHGGRCRAALALRDGGGADRAIIGVRGSPSVSRVPRSTPPP